MTINLQDITPSRNRRHITLIGLSVMCSVFTIASILLHGPDALADDEQTVEQLFQQIKSESVIDEQSFITNNLVPLGQTVIDVLLPKLEKPRLDEVDGVTVENDDIMCVQQVFSLMGNMAFTNLLQHVTATNASFRANVLSVICSEDREDCFVILTNALNDIEYAMPGDSRGAPERICDEIYLTLWSKIKSLGFTPPYRISRYDSFSEEIKDQKIQELKNWWTENGAQVMQRFHDTHQ